MYVTYIEFSWNSFDTLPKDHCGRADPATIWEAYPAGGDVLFENGTYCMDYSFTHIDCKSYQLFTIEIDCHGLLW